MNTAAAWLLRAGKALLSVTWARWAGMALAVLLALWGLLKGIQGYADRGKAELIRQNAALQSQNAFYKAQNRTITANYNALRLAYENPAQRREFECDGVATIETLEDGRRLVRCEGKVHEITIKEPVMPPPIQPPTQATPSPYPEVVAGTATRRWLLGAGLGMADWKTPTPVLGLGYEWTRLYVMIQGGPKMGIASVGIRF